MRRRWTAYVLGIGLLAAPACFLLGCATTGSPPPSTPAAVDMPPPPPTTEVALSFVNFREAPSMSGKVIRVLDKGTSLILLEDRDGWLRVELADKTKGWVGKTMTLMGARPADSRPANSEALKAEPAKAKAAKRKADRGRHGRAKTGKAKQRKAKAAAAKAAEAEEIDSEPGDSE